MSSTKHALCLLLIALVSAGCAHTGHVGRDRFSPTGIAPGEAVAILLAQRCAGLSESDCEEVPSAMAQMEFETCFGDAMRAKKSDLAIIPANEFLRSAFPVTDLHEAPRTSEAWLPMLHDAEFHQRVNRLRVRYLVVLKVSTFEGSSRRTFGAAQGMWGVGGEWDRTSSMVAEILDLREARQSGKLTSSAHGKQGYVVPVFVIIPLPPVPYFAATEAKACSSLGRAAAKFVLEKDL